MKRAIFYCNFPPPVTGQTIGTEVVRELLQDEVDIVRLDTSNAEMSVGRGLGGLWRRATTILRHARALRRELRRAPTDVVYFVVSSSAIGQLRDALTVWLSKGRTRRIVAHVRSGNYHENFGRFGLRALSRYVVQSLDQMIFLSRHLAERSAQFVPDEKRAVVFNTIDPAVHVSDEEVTTKVARRSARERLQVVYISNMIATKGYWDLAKAVAAVRDEVPLAVDFVGSFPTPREREEFERFVHNHDLGATVHIHGGIADRAVIRRLLLGADVFVLPTYFPVEAQPRSIIEALNAGVPVVATRHASIPEYVVDGDNGYLVDLRSPDQIGRALTQLADLGTWRERAEAARRSYRELFDPAVLRRGLLDALLG